MDDLRLILALLGIGVIVAVYVWTRFQQRGFARRRSRAPSKPSAVRPRSDEPDVDDVAQELERMEQLVQGREEEATVEQDSERVEVISVVAPEGAQFHGDELAKAFEHNQLYPGDQGIYHRMVVQGMKQRAVFGVANLVKPGTFPLQDMARFRTPGVTLFLQLPGPLDGVEAFDDFVNTAERLAVELGGELKDQRHSILTHQALMQIRESIAEAGLRAQVAS
ncbi:cell division protein ZipA [Thiogranum longum]